MITRFRIVLVVAFHLGLLSAAGFAAEAPVKFRVAYGTVTSGYSVVWVAKDAGIFARNGLDLELLMIQSSPILAAAMVAGNVPAAIMGGSAAIASNLGGSDLVLIGSLRKISSLAFFVTAKEISRPAQLRGKTLGIDRYGGSGDFVLRLVLGKLGLDPEKDVTIRQVGQSPVRLTALQTGAIQGTILSAEDRVAANRLGLPVLVDASKLGVEFLGADLVTTRSLLKTEEPTLRKFVKSIVEGIRYYKTHKSESLRTIARYMKVKDAAILEAGYDFNAQEYLAKPYPSLGGMQTALEQLAQTNPKAKDADIKRFFDPRFVRELDQSGYIDALYK